ncbi:thermonuclease family protein [Pelagerythrobacter sp.]|uniref:thermonuclease family protein n=1 Tax=Pelagerythrobacter sp. TaxID=2800702 RepID=UPI0035B31C85
METGRLEDPTAVDGDTIRSGDGRVRLWGVDAPELRQSGYDRQGNAVAIGEQSRDWLQGEIVNAPAVTLDDVAGTSWGRTVGPVSLDGRDAGQAVIRSGNALAAPEYLEGDDKRRFDYMEAERLARLNQLGPMNDTAAQRPADFRKGSAPRETVAQFWDTPTPLQGMRPEAEQEYLRLLDGAPAEEISAFAESQGFRLEPGYLASWVEDRDERKAKGLPYTVAASYGETPLAMQELGDGATGAGVRGFGEGFVASGLGELGAVADALGGTPGRENVWNSDRRLADIWANNEYQNEAILRGDEHAHPTASTVGEIGGAITSGFVIPYGAGARTVPQLARVGAVYGGAEGFLGTDGSVPERLKGAAIGAPTGAIVNAVGGKALEAVAPLAGRAGRAIQDRFGRATPRSEVVGDGAQPASDWPGRIVNEQTIAMEAAPAPTLSVPVRQRDYLDVQAVRPTRFSDPLDDAQRQAAAANVQPRDVLPLPANTIDGVEEAIAKDADRFIEAHAPNERFELSRTTIKNFMGAPVPKVGPMDMVGWLRTRGGLVDQGGEVSAMGITSNAARKGIDFVGQEMRFGPMLNDEGLTLDDAAFEAWEAGFFPELTDRPSVNQFLDALRETYDGGRGRRFLPDDIPELERFYAMQANRYDLEQRQEEVGGPVYDDTAASADQGQPFPPVVAYEEWPSEAIQRVGNIDVTKLDSPQDIRRALKTSHNAMGGFDAATRGRITQAETERLADELGMTADQLLSRREGQAFNAEEALAARQILAKSYNELHNIAKRVSQLEEPGDELMAEFRRALVRASAIQEQVSGATAEAGRALQQFRMPADSRRVRGEMLNALVRGGGGRENLQDAADLLLEAAEVGTGKFSTQLGKLTKPKWRRRIGELYINFLLSNPATHVVNMTSNTLTSMAQIPEHAAASVIGKARQIASRDPVDRVVASEVGARAFGLIQGAKEGAKLMARAIRTGEASDYVSKVEGDEYKAIPGVVGEVIRVPTRLLTAEDELFKGMARRMAINSMAVRKAHGEGLKGESAKARIAELSQNPTDEMLDEASDYGRYLTFQNKLDPFTQSISNASQQNIVAKLFLPFVRTPTNILKFAAERSPVAPLVKRWRDDFKAGGARRDVAIAKAMLGTGFGMAVYEAALEGHITGALPSDAKKARLLRAEGWQEYSVKIGDTYYSYKRLDPFAMTLGVAADMATLPDGMSEREKSEKHTLLVASIIGNLSSKTWLSGISDLVAALDEPGRYTDNMLERLVGSLTVPAGVAGVARSMDPTSRQVEGWGQAVANRIPGLRDDLTPRRDIWGEVVTYDAGFLSPAYRSRARHDPVNLELLQVGYAPGYPSRTVGGEELSTEEYDRYSEMAGKGAHDAIRELIASEEWAGLDREAKAKEAQKAVSAARRDARERLFGDGDSADSAEEDERPGSSVGGEQWPGTPVASRDVKAELEARIPGIRFTSGYRSPEYNESLRARGYNPAKNSEHLEGAALDMLPPPGKSLAWLKARVRRYDPKARLLVHDGHLHAGFDDYYDAPAIGGMARS